MAKRLDAKALKGAFARGKTKRNLDFLVPDKAPEQPASDEPASEALATSGPQRRKAAATKRTAAKRKAARKRTTKRAAAHAKARGKAQPAPQPVRSEVKPEPAVSEATPAPGAEATRVVHQATPVVEVPSAAIEAELELTALYDGWAPAAPVQRPGLFRRVRARVRRACETLVSTAVNRAFGPRSLLRR